MLPLEGDGSVLVGEIIDGPVGVEVPADLFGLPVGDLLDLPEVSHVDLVPHFFLNDVAGSGVDHHGFHEFAIKLFNPLNICELRRGVAGTCRVVALKSGALILNITIIRSNGLDRI